MRGERGGQPGLGWPETVINSVSPDAEHRYEGLGWPGPRETPLLTRSGSLRFVPPEPRNLERAASEPPSSERAAAARPAWERSASEWSPAERLSAERPVSDPPVSVPPASERPVPEWSTSEFPAAASPAPVQPTSDRPDSGSSASERPMTPVPANVSRETATPGRFGEADPVVAEPDETAVKSEQRSADEPKEKRVAATAIGPPIVAWPPPEHSDRLMIASSYSGAESAQAESEDDVAISGAPDTSADTPIARAAQAAMNARAVSRPWPRPQSCRILTIANQKGGVGKTTSAVNLAASLAMHGSRVLVIDLDPQGNASTALDVDHRSGTASIYNVLVDGRSLVDVIRPVEGFPLLHCAPATIDLAGAEIELVPLVARESRLTRAVAEYDVSELDYIFIDCPPSLGLLTVNALVAAPEVLIPIQCEYYALEGLEQLLRTVELVKSHLNPGLKVTTILLTMFDSRTRLASQVADEVRSHFGELVLGSVIPRSVRVSEAPSYGQSVMTYDPGSSGAVAYLEAAKEMAFQNSNGVVG
jgi:chromosome partitioning protein